MIYTIHLLFFGLPTIPPLILLSAASLLKHLFLLNSLFFDSKCQQGIKIMITIV